MLDSGGFFATHGKGRLFVTVHDAVLHSTSTQNLVSLTFDIQCFACEFPCFQRRINLS